MILITYWLFQNYFSHFKSSSSVSRSSSMIFIGFFFSHLHSHATSYITDTCYGLLTLSKNLSSQFKITGKKVQNYKLCRFLSLSERHVILYFYLLRQKIKQHRLNYSSSKHFLFFHIYFCIFFDTFLTYLFLMSLTLTLFSTYCITSYSRESWPIRICSV